MSVRGAAIILLGALCASCAGSVAPERPNVLLISLNATRADRLGCYGYDRGTSPNLDALAGESLLYTRAVSPSSWTLPAHASLFTGKFPTSHGARYDTQGPLRLSQAGEDSNLADLIRARGIAAGETTLALTMKGAGLRTGAIVGGPWLKRVFGLDRGFDHYDDSDILPGVGRIAESVTGAALEWVDRQEGRPFFLFLNYYDPHGPYGAPQPYQDQFLRKPTTLDEAVDPFRRMSDRYDGEILYMDLHLGALFDGLRERALFENTLIVITADHGELLGEHDKHGHGSYLTEPEIHVPLIVRRPGPAVRAEPSDARVQLTDILPMILVQLGLPLPKEIQGGPPPEVNHPIAAEVYPLPWATPDGDWRALYEGDLKFLWNSKGQHQLFDLASDPDENDNLYDSRTEQADAMATRLAGYLDSLPSPGKPPTGELDDETKELLRSLGYMK